MNRSSLAALVLVAGTAPGCGSSGIAYAPSSAPAAAPRRVALRVEDNRPPREGGADPALVGFRRGGFGNKFNVKEAGPGVVATLARSVAVVALGRAGIAVDPGARATLDAQVLSFWMDWSGYDFISGIAYTGNVAIEYTLTDASGRILWRRTAVVEQHHSTSSKDRVFEPALRRLAARSASLFQSSGFPALE